MFSKKVCFLYIVSWYGRGWGFFNCFSSFGKGLLERREDRVERGLGRKD